MKAIIIGKHPLAESLVRQYEVKGGIVVHREYYESLPTGKEGISVNDYDELCLLASDDEDDKMVAILAQLAEGYNVEAHGGRRLVCHLLVQRNETLRMLQTCDLCNVVKRIIDLYPFTMDEVWSRSIVLDYEPITVQSKKRVHLIIFGMSEIAEMVAIQAAHVAHYPNYIRNHSLRTRITIIGNQDGNCKSTSTDFSWTNGFVKRYQHLFDNSYYRLIKPSEETAVVKFHKPMYEGLREDFVDVEWEFVESESWSPDVREKLKLWANDNEQLLTVVMAGKNYNKNMSEALHLPNELYEKNIPIHIYGQQTVEYDVTLPLIRMAKNVNYIYDRCYEENYGDYQSSKTDWHLRYSVEIDPEERERSWAKLSNVKRMSSIYNAMTIATKMRSIGLKEYEWSKFYDIPQQDIELLAQVEHNRWSVEELILGFRPCTDEEQKIIEADVKTQKNTFKMKKIHYDLRAYNDLRPDGTGKLVQAYDLCLCSCLPLIANDFIIHKL